MGRDVSTCGMGRMDKGHAICPPSHSKATGHNRCNVLAFFVCDNVFEIQIGLLEVFFSSDYL